MILKIYDSDSMNLYKSIPLLELKIIAGLWERVWFNMHLVPGRAIEIKLNVAIVVLFE